MNTQPALQSAQHRNVVVQNEYKLGGVHIGHFTHAWISLRYPTCKRTLAQGAILASPAYANLLR